MSKNNKTNQMQREPIEALYAKELDFLKTWDQGPKPHGWQLTPKAVVTFIMGSSGEKLKLKKGAKKTSKTPASTEIVQKFVGEKALIERAVVTLAGERGLIFVGEPGTAKSMLSELLAAAISGNSSLTVQGTAGTIEEHFRYSWNYSMLLSQGYSLDALTPSVILQAMTLGNIARVEEITRCLPEVQDALVSILSERRLIVPEIAGKNEEAWVEYAQKGFNVIATANLRDKGVSEMSAALKRRFNFENVPPIANANLEAQLVKSQAQSLLTQEELKFDLDDAIVDTLITCFRDLRTGLTEEGWSVERPTAVMSTAEAVSVACSLGRKSIFFSSKKDILNDLPGYIKGVVVKDEPKDHGKLLSYWDGPILQRAKQNQRIWKNLYELRQALELEIANS